MPIVVLEKRSSICRMRVRAVRLDIVIFKVDKKDSSQEISELIDTYTAVRAGYEKVSSDTELTWAHLSV